MSNANPKPAPVTARDLLTAYARRKQRRDAKIALFYYDSLKEPGAIATAIISIIRRKYRIKSPSTVYVILRRYNENQKIHADQ